MPQKRNPFLFEQEHIQGMVAAAAGAFVTATMSMHAKPFSNSVAAGTEAVSSIWQPLQTMTDAIFLMRLLVNGAVPDKEAMLSGAIRGYSTAAELANRLSVHGSMSFREAHRFVGELVNEALQKNYEPIGKVAERMLSGQSRSFSLADLDPTTVAFSNAWGGGPGRSVERCLQSIRLGWSKHLRGLNAQSRRWRNADRLMRRQIEGLLGEVKPWNRNFRKEIQQMDAKNHKATYYFCDDKRQDHVAENVFQAVTGIIDTTETGLKVDDRPVLMAKDDKGNEYVLVRTAEVVSHNYSRYLPIMNDHFGDSDFAGIVNWHEGRNAPDKILTVHTTGDVVSGHFGPLCIPGTCATCCWHWSVTAGTFG